MTVLSHLRRNAANTPPGENSKMKRRPPPPRIGTLEGGRIGSLVGNRWIVSLENATIDSPFGERSGPQNPPWVVNVW